MKSSLALSIIASSSGLWHPCRNTSQKGVYLIQRHFANRWHAIVACALIVLGLNYPSAAQQPLLASSTPKPTPTPEPQWCTTLDRCTFPSAPPLLYRFLKPAKIEPGKTYPLVLFLHGAGERGNDNSSQLRNSVGDIVRLTSQNHPCFLLVPQCPNNKRWVEVDWKLDSHVMPKSPSESMTAAMALVDKISKENPVDAKRIYIAGISMGGFGTWDAISRFPEKFAAAIPVCGGADLAEAPKLVTMPIWAFHGTSDTVVKTHRSADMVEAIQKAGGQPKYTAYQGIGHGCWGATFSNPEVIDWLFSQSKK